MKNKLNVLTSLVICLFISNTLLAQSPSAAKAAKNVIPSSEIKMKKVGKYSVKTVELSQLKNGQNTIKFSANQTVEVNFSGNKVSNMLLISGTGVRTPFGTSTSAFQCTGGNCSCSGDADCNDMFSSDVCQRNGPVVNGACVGTGCTCVMKSN